MIDTAQDISRIVFAGDFDEPVTLTKVAGPVYSLTGIFGYQGENP
jgi:hypothetical protein